MNKFLTLLAFLLVFVFQIKAQRDLIMNHDGVAVAVSSKTMPPVAESELRKSISEYFSVPKTGNKFTRGYIDTKNQMVFCYDLEYSPVAGSKQFTVSIESREKCNAYGEYKDFKQVSLPKYPHDLTINDGDTIVLDILKNNQTGALIQDLIKITREQKPLGGYFADLAPSKDFTLNDVQMQLIDYEVYINDKLVTKDTRSTDKDAFSTMIGAAVGFTFNKRGTFTFSPFPNEKYKLQKMGVIEDNKLIFSYNGDNYKIVSKVSILGNGQKWNVWGKFEPFDTKISQMPDWMNYRTKSGTIEGFMDDKPLTAKPIMIFNMPSAKP